MNYYNHNFGGQDYIILLSDNRDYAIAIDRECEMATEIDLIGADLVTDEVLFNSILDACKRSEGENTAVMFSDSTPEDTRNIYHTGGA